MTKNPKTTDTLSVEETQAKIISYLETYAANGGVFIKSKYVAKELGLNPKVVGTNLSLILKNNDTLIISRWGGSTSTTWSIALKNE